MTSKLIPKNPAELMVIRNVTPNIVTFSVPFARFGSIQIGGRGTLVALTEETKAKITELGGTVAYIVATDIEHHIFITEWAKAYPDAKIIGPEGLPEKRAKMKDDKIGQEKFAVVFTKENKHEIHVDDAFDADFEYEYADGHQNKELAFFYKPDKALIEADLLFNLPANEQYSKVPENERKTGAAAKLFVGLQNPEGDATWMKRFNWYLAAKDKPSLNASVARIDTWDFDMIIPCHGDVVEKGAKELFRKVFAWHLQGKGTKA